MKKENKVTELPESIQKQIKRYMNLDLGKDGIVCPYYMNLKRSKDLRAMVGKGNPEEIELEARMWEKLKGVHFEKMTAKEIKEFLFNRGIGIDCSGFIVHILNPFAKETTGKNIWNILKLPNKSLISRIAYKLKPVEKLGAEIITNSENTDIVEVKDVRVGDLVRTKWKKKNSHHILIISKVMRDKNDKLIEIEYTHSIPQYGDDSGVKTGNIRILDENKPLHEQEWLEVDEKGVNHTLQGYMVQLEDNGLRRLKNISLS